LLIDREKLSSVSKQEAIEVLSGVIQSLKD
jgi:hypothetical protein